MRQFTSSKAEFDRFENRRRYPRVVLDKNVNLFLPGNQPVSVTLHDISECAIQARFNAGTEETIRLALENASAVDKPLLGIKFRIKLHDHVEDIFVSCNPVCICQLDSDIFAMGLQFSDLESKYQTLINKFIEVSLEPV
jgi:hypothetical protein